MIKTENEINQLTYSSRVSNICNMFRTKLVQHWHVDIRELGWFFPKIKKHKNNNSNNNNNNNNKKQTR